MALFAGCDPQNTYNSEAAQQNTAQADAKANALHPAEGNYCGTMHLVQSNLDFEVHLTLKVVSDNVHSSSSTDPTDTVQVPKLAGTMTFPAIANEGSAAYSTLPDLIQATGGYGSVAFTYGDYNPMNHKINLPFTVPGAAQGNYGAVTGGLEGDTFTGSWYSEASQLVGTFTIDKCGRSS
jgi:hypothetical protein